MNLQQDLVSRMPSPITTPSSKAEGSARYFFMLLKVAESWQMNCT